MGTAFIVMRHPCVHDASQVMLGEWDHTIQAFPSQRADEPLAERIGLRRPYRRLAHPQPQVADALVELVREDAIAVMDEEAIGMVSGNRFAQLLECPGCSG